jgi:hypothetical protein
MQKGNGRSAAPVRINPDGQQALRMRGPDGRSLSAVKHTILDSTALLLLGTPHESADGCVVPLFPLR